MKEYDNKNIERSDTLTHVIRSAYSHGNRIYIGDVIEKLKLIESGSVQMCVTSPPYWGLRDYGHDGQIGLEKTPEEYIAKLVSVFEEVRRVLRSDGTLWLNLGDSYISGKGRYSSNKQTIGGEFRDEPMNGKRPDQKNHEYLKDKDLAMIPARTAIELQKTGWWLRSEIVWHKPNPVPESVEDRPTKSHEMIYLLTKSAKYYYDVDAIREEHEWIDKDNLSLVGKKCKTDGDKKADSINWIGRSRKERYHPNGRNKRDVWTMNTENFDGAHFATFPTELPKTCILAGSKKGDIVLDPFFGSGTTGEMAMRLERNFIGIEINEQYVRGIAEKRVNGVEPLFKDAVAVL